MVVVFVYRTPVRALLPNHEVVEFQPQSVTTPILGSVGYCYKYIIPILPDLPSCLYNTLLGRSRLMPYQPTPPVAPLHGIILPPGRPPSLSQNTDTTSSIHGFLCSPERHLHPMPLPRLLPSLAIVLYLLIPPNATPS